MKENDYQFKSENSKQLCKRAMAIAMTKRSTRESELRDTNVVLLEEHLKHMTKEDDKRRALKTIEHLKGLVL